MTGLTAPLPPGLADPTVPEGEPFARGGRVAVVRLDGGGDVLLASPAVRAVAARAEEVVLVCGPGGADLGRLLPGVDRVLALELPWVPLRPGPFDPARVDHALDQLRAVGADAALVLTSDHQSPLPTALLLRQAGVPRLAAVSADHPGGLLDVRLRAADGHEVERGLALAAAAGYPAVDGDELRVRVPAGPLPVGVEPGAVVVHPGATVVSRGLPAQAASDLVALLAAEGTSVALTGSAAETATLAASAPPGVVDLGGHTDAGALARVLAAAGAVVVGNTGPAHLAAAVGTPIVSVFAPVVPWERWRPWSSRVVAVGDRSVPCAGCRARRCPFPGQPCTAGVTGAGLHAAVHRLLAGGPPVAAPTVGTGVRA